MKHFDHIPQNQKRLRFAESTEISCIPKITCYPRNRVRLTVKNYVLITSRKRGWHQPIQSINLHEIINEQIEWKLLLLFDHSLTKTPLTQIDYEHFLIYFVADFKCFRRKQLFFDSCPLSIYESIGREKYDLSLITTNICLQHIILSILPNQAICECFTNKFFVVKLQFIFVLLFRSINGPSL